MIVVVGLLLHVLILGLFGSTMVIECRKQKVQHKSSLGRSPLNQKKAKKGKKTKKRVASYTEVPVQPVLANPHVTPAAQQPEIRTQQTQPSSRVVPVDPKVEVPATANQNVALNQNKKSNQLEKSIAAPKSKTLKPVAGSAEVNKKFVEHSKTMSLKLANTDKTQIPSVNVPVAKPQAKKQRSVIAKVSKKSVKSTKQEDGKGVKTQTADDDDEGLPIPQPQELDMDRTQRSLSNRPNDDDDTNDNIDDLRQDTQRSE
ncbi:hypothetical protein M3Y95_00832300 [Aphelenchoides besseyi]|nr:hypothetical protein M3Y95_00832300 [Aphelenchoides besseyi]